VFPEFQSTELFPTDQTMDPGSSGDQLSDRNNIYIPTDDNSSNEQQSYGQNDMEDDAIVAFGKRVLTPDGPVPFGSLEVEMERGTSSLNIGSENSMETVKDESYPIKKKPKTFREVFNLDEEISDESCGDSFSESGQDSQGFDDEMGEERSDMNTESADDSLSMGGRDVGIRGLGCEIEMKSEDADAVFAGQSPATATCESTDDSRVSEAIEDTPYTEQDEESLLDTPQVVSSIVDYASDSNEGMEDQPEHLASVKQEQDARQSYESTNTENSLSDNSVLVLKILEPSLGFASFVIKKKSGLTQEELEEVFKECSDLGYMSGSGMLWKITDLGKQFLSDNRLIDEDTKPDMSVNASEPAVKKKTVSKGPPPSPMALLKAMGHQESVATTVMSSFKNNQPKMSNSEIPSLLSISVQSSSGRLPQFQNVGTIQAQPFPNLVKQSPGSYPGSYPGNNDQVCQMNTNLWSQGALCSSVQSGIKSSVVDNRTSTPYQRPTPAPIIKPLQNKQKAPELHIPDKYADYPNKKTTEQLFKQRPGSGKSSDSVSQSAPPPSPMDILLRSMKKTEISPSKTANSSVCVSIQNSQFSSQTQTCSQINISPPINSSATAQFSQLRQGLVSPASIMTTTQHIASHGQGALAPGIMQQTGSMSSYQKSIQPGSYPGNVQSMVRSAGPPPSPASILAKGSQYQQAAGGYSSLPVQPATRLQQQPIAPVKQQDLSLALSSESFAALNKNPVSALMEYAQSRKTSARVEVISRRGASHRPTYVYLVV